MAGESLKVVAGNAAGSSIALEQELVVGRSTPGLGSLGGDSEISRVHSRIYHDASGQLIVEDLGSTNGTFVNGNRIAAATPLRAGDQVRVGQTTMTVEGGATEGATTVGQVVPPPAAAAPPPPAAVAATPPTQQFAPAQPPPGQFAGGQQPGYAGGPIGGAPQRASGGSKAPWIALAAVVVIALIVAALAIGGVFSSDDKKETASTTPAATTPATTTPTPTTPATTTPASSPPEMQGPAGTMGPPPTGQYDVHNQTVLNHIEAALKRYLATKGVPNAKVTCVALSNSKAGCRVVNPANGKSIVLAVKVNQNTGKLTLV
jgi:predicted component of type VI protein secretion system